MCELLWLAPRPKVKSVTTITNIHEGTPAAATAGLAPACWLELVPTRRFGKVSALAARCDR